jgi:hypothetical protein
MAIRLCGVEPALGRLSDVLNPHRQMKPIEHMVSRAQFMKFTRATVVSAHLPPPARWRPRPAFRYRW